MVARAIPTPGVQNEELLPHVIDVAISGTSAPSLPRILWDAWNVYARRAGGYQSELLLSFVYFAVLGPSALLARVGTGNLIDLSNRTRSSYWIQRKPINRTLVDMEREF